MISQLHWQWVYIPPQVFNLTDLVPENGSTPNINENTGGVLES